jgi:CRISPR-associated exonuclease Cas4
MATPDITGSRPTGERDEDDSRLVVLVSALNHYLFCDRRCALIHTEGVFPVNEFVEQGNRVHAAADTPGYRERRGCRTVRALPLFSDQFALSGRADIVEFWPRDGREEARPVDYKRGKGAGWENNHVQLCAQALCLEEMFATSVVQGSIYHALSRRRSVVWFDAELRRRTVQVIGAARELLESGRIPPPVYRARCHGCSLEPVCLPRQSGKADAFTRYMRRLFAPGAAP